MTDYTITELDISYEELTKLPDDMDKYTNLKELECSDNQITSLDNLPSKLETLYCSNNKITRLDNLPQKLKVLCCAYNPLKYDFEATLENIRNYIDTGIIPE